MLSICLQKTMVLIIGVFCANVAMAQTTDIAGITLGMSESAAIEKLKSHSKFMLLSKSIMEYNNPISNDKNQKFAIGLNASNNNFGAILAVPPEKNGVVQDGISDNFKLEYTYPPGKPEVVSIKRDVSNIKNPPTPEQLLSNYQKKYGSPIFSKGSLHVWVYNSDDSCMKNLKTTNPSWLAYASPGEIYGHYSQSNDFKRKFQSCEDIVTLDLSGRDLVHSFTTKSINLRKFFKSIDEWNIFVEKNKAEALNMKKTQGQVPKI